MKKFALKATALAIGAVCGSSVWAGSFTTPANDAAATKYANEAVLSTTDVTLPAFTYTMGVGRGIGANMTILLTPSAGSTFTVASCTTAIPVVAVAGVATITVKRASASECAYDAVVTTAFTTSTTLTFTGLVLDTHPLNTAGGATTLTLALKDPGETSFVDNVASVSRRVATGAQAINIYAATSDAATVADVGATGGPLTGFVVGGAAPADTATIAKMNLTFDNNTALAQTVAGNANFDFTTTTGTSSITLTGSTTGLKANSFCLDVDNDSTLCETGEVFTATAGAATLSAIPSSVFPAVTTTATRLVSFEVDGTTQLGTARTFALTGTITPQVGAAEALADTASKNATSWVWSANASQLMTPYLSTNALYVTRFALLNTGSTAVAYTVKCYAEGSNVPTNGAGGNLKAAGTTVINASDACSFSDAATPRGAVVFTINTPVNNVKGTYNIVDKVSGANGFMPLTRPYNSANTTE